MDCSSELLDPLLTNTCHTMDLTNADITYEKKNHIQYCYLKNNIFLCQYLLVLTYKIFIKIYFSYFKS